MSIPEHEENNQKNRKKIWAFIIISLIVTAAAIVGAMWFMTDKPVEEAPVAETEGADTEESAEFADVEVIFESEMAEDTKNEIKTITDTFQTALNEKNAGKIMAYKSAEFEATQGQLTSFFESATASGKAPYELFGTYYVKDVKDPQSMVKVKKSEKDDNFAMFTPGKNEMCAALFVSKNEKVSQMITLLIARGEEKMEIVWIDTSDYDYYGKNAPEYLKLAKSAKESGKNVLAYVYAQMMHNIFQPGNAYYYKETDEITVFINEINTWGQENLPTTVLDDKHTIHMIGLALEDVGVVPMIYCQTEVDMESADIQADAEKVKSAFLEKYPEFNGAFEKIVVHASNISPAEDTTGAGYKKFAFDIK